MPALSPHQSLAIDLADVAKTYRGKVHALRGISMQVNRGEVFGLLGPNGAGKSTLVKILMTVIRPTRCRGMMLGDPVGTKPTLRRVGYLPEHHRFADYLTGAQILDFYGAMAGVPRRERRARAGELLDLVGMTAWADKRVRGYSKGMRQRIGVAQALINDPDLVLLDEPTDGVDPVGRRDIRNILLHIKERGKTVFLNSHLLSELEMVSDRVAIIVRGVVASQGTIDELTRDRQRYEIELASEAHDQPAAAFHAALPGVFAAPALNGSTIPSPFAPPALPGVPARRVSAEGRLATGERVELDHAVLRIATTDAARVQPVIDALRARGAVIRAVRPVRPSLEDLFMQAVTDPTTGEVLAPGAGPAADGNNYRAAGAKVIRP
jgi:ABC-2 type transport system ATP-binding protein